jgi:hypothetical protein
MKRLIILLGFILMAVTSCNDEDGDPIGPEEQSASLLTKISRNGVTYIELYYDVNRRLYRLDYYFGGALATYNLYEYAGGGLKELRRYTDDHVLEFRSVFTLDNFARIIKVENYATPDLTKLSSITQFSYNAAGLLVKRDFNTPGNPIYSRHEYTYDAQNRLTQVKNTLYPTQPTKYLSYQVDYVPGDVSMPAEWEEYVSILELSGLGEGMRDMFNNSTHSEIWNDDQETTYETVREASEREIDENSNLTRQLLTSQSLLNPQNAAVVSEMTYEYAN